MFIPIVAPMPEVLHDCLSICFEASVWAIKPLHVPIVGDAVELLGPIRVGADQPVGMPFAYVQEDVVHNVLVNVCRVPFSWCQAEIPHTAPFVLEQELCPYRCMVHGCLQQRLHFSFGVLRRRLQKLENDLAILFRAIIFQFPCLPGICKENLLVIHNRRSALTIHQQPMVASACLPAQCGQTMLNCYTASWSQPEIQNPHAMVFKQVLHP
mmetsp:Transcript_21809/g.39196  ORF Transcript_21809/g.39196 Transcript_21809/m.39196 type:complete len:211 (+) Transcript_21809:1457-2089(+)